MALSDLLAADAVSMLSADPRGQQITYYPGGQLFDPRSIRARLEREPPDGIAVAGGSFVALAWRIKIARASLLGVIPQEAKDLVDLPLHVGAPVDQWRRFRVDRILELDHPGFWILGILR